MNADLLAQEAAIRAEADILLWERGLYPLLQAYGPIEITGSYALHTMAWRDLDLYLAAPDLSVETFFELGGRVARCLGPYRMSYRDERIGQTPGLPRNGRYWGIYLDDERAGAWKIDLWCISPQERERLQAYVSDLATRLTPEARLRILDIKSQCWMRPGYRSQFTSRDIYRAVLDHGVTDLAGFAAYLRETRGDSANGALR
jgi:hypothetical protein